MLITQNQVFLIAFSPGFVAIPVMRPRKMRAELFLDTERVKIAMILRYKYTVFNKKAKKNSKLCVDRLQAMTGIIYEPLVQCIKPDFLGVYTNKNSKFIL